MIRKHIRQVNFIMIYIIHKISVLLKTIRILKRFLRSIIDFYLLKASLFFSQHKMIKISRLEKDKNMEENKIKDVINLFRLKKNKAIK